MNELLLQVLHTSLTTLLLRPNTPPRLTHASPPPSQPPLPPPQHNPAPNPIHPVYSATPAWRHRPLPCSPRTSGGPSTACRRYLRMHNPASLPACQMALPHAL